MLNLLPSKLWATISKLLNKLTLKNSRIWPKIWLRLSLLQTKKMTRLFSKTLGSNSMKSQKSSQSSSRRKWRISLLPLKTSFLRPILQMIKLSNSQSNSTLHASREFQPLLRKTLSYWLNSFNSFSDLWLMLMLISRKAGWDQKKDSVTIMTMEMRITLTLEKVPLISLSQQLEMNLLFQFLVELLMKHFKMILTGDSRMPHLWLSLKLVNTLTKSKRSDKWFQSLLHI